MTLRKRRGGLSPSQIWQIRQIGPGSTCPIPSRLCRACSTPRRQSRLCDRRYELGPPRRRQAAKRAVEVCAPRQGPWELCIGIGAPDAAPDSRSVAPTLRAHPLLGDEVAVAAQPRDDDMVRRVYVSSQVGL